MKNNKNNKKFRIYDKATDGYMTENGMSLHCFSQFMVDVFSGDIYDAVGVIDGDHVPDNQRTLEYTDWYMDGKAKIKKGSPYVLQQYIGVNDKKGNELYEGDVIEFKEGKKGFETYQESITFEDGVFGIKLYGTMKPIGELFDVKLIKKELEEDNW